MVETAIFSRYGPVIKPTGIAIYCLLLSQANEARECEVSVDFICASLGLAKGTAIKFLSKLETYRLIGKAPDPEDRRRVRYTLPPITEGPASARQAIGANFEPITCTEDQPTKAAVVDAQANASSKIGSKNEPIITGSAEIGSNSETSSNSAPIIGSNPAPSSNFAPIGTAAEGTPPPTPPSPSRSPKGTVTETQNFVPSGREANASSGEAGQAKAAKRGSGEPHPETQRLMVAYGEALNRPGGHIPARGQNGKSAKALLQAGYTVEQVMGCYAWVKSDPWWKHKLVTLTEIEKQIGEWVNAGQPETWSKPGGGYSGATGGSSGYRGTSSRGGTGAGRLQPAGGNNLAKLAERDRDEVAQYLASLGVELPPGSGSD